MMITIVLKNKTIAHYKLSEFEVTESNSWLILTDKEGGYTVKYLKRFIISVEMREKKCYGNTN